MKIRFRSANSALGLGLLGLLLAAVPDEARTQGRIDVNVSATDGSGGISSVEEQFPIGDVFENVTSGASNASASYSNRVIRLEASSSWAGDDGEDGQLAGATSRLGVFDTFTIMPPLGSTDLGANLSFSFAMSGSLFQSNALSFWSAEGQWSAPAYRDDTFGIVQPFLTISAGGQSSHSAGNIGTPLPVTLTSAPTGANATTFFLYNQPIDFRWILLANLGHGPSGVPGSAFTDLGNSAVWLGITARDADGALIEGLQITSASGENWLAAGVVPEPASFWLSAVALAAIVGARHAVRKRAREGV
jgi:hypothetical protein